MLVWTVGSYGVKKKHWFCYRYLEPNGRNQVQLTDKVGRTRWFKSYEAAFKAAQNSKL